MDNIKDFNLTQNEYIAKQQEIYGSTVRPPYKNRKLAENEIFDVIRMER
jgi:hypothetical protein